MTQSHRKKAQADDLKQVRATDTVHHEASRKRHPKPKGVAQLQLTSMMDVVFQLLIFFILTANFALDEGVLPADLPQGQSSQQTLEVPKEPLIIKVDPISADGGVRLWLKGTGDLGDSFEQLYSKLSGWRASGQYEADYPIVIKPSPDVQWGYVVNSFNVAVRAKFTNVSFAKGG